MLTAVVALLSSLYLLAQSIDVHKPIQTFYDTDSLVDPSLVFPFADIIPTSRVHHTLVANREFLVVYGGYSDNGTILGDTNLYHIPTQTWSGPITREECCNDQTETVDVIGAMRSFQFPFLKSGQQGDYPLPRAEHASCVVNDVMYIFGGVTADYGLMNDLYAFDTNNLQWSLIYTSAGADSTPQRRAGHAILSYENRYFYLFGGRASSDNRNVGLYDLWKFDLENRIWERVDGLSNSSPLGRHYMGSAVMGSQIFIHSGADPNSNFLYDDLWSFSLNSGRWTNLYTASSKNGYEYAPPPLIYSHLIPVTTDTSTGLVVYGGIGSGGACVGDGPMCKQLQVSFGQVYLYSLGGETWLQPMQDNDYEIKSTTLQSHWLFARLTNGTNDLLNPSNTGFAKLTKAYCMEKIVVNSVRKTFYEFGGVRALDSATRDNGQQVLKSPQSQDVGGFDESTYSDTQSGEQLRNRVNGPVNGYWTFRSAYSKAGNISFENTLRLFSISATDIGLISEY